MSREARYILENFEDSLPEEIAVVPLRSGNIASLWKGEIARATLRVRDGLCDSKKLRLYRDKPKKQGIECVAEYSVKRNKSLPMRILFGEITSRYVKRLEC